MGVDFPTPAVLDAIEWAGSPMGLSNVITRTKGRTRVHDKSIDRLPGRRDELVAAAQAKLQNPGIGYDHDVVIHGIRVRAHTNMLHLYDFWVDNWYSPEEWHRLTGQEPPRHPQVEVFAVGHVEGQPEAAYYSRNTNTIAFFNTSYYGQLKSWVLGAVGRVLAEEYGIHSIHGACTAKEGQGVLFIAPTGTGKSTASYGLMSYPNTRFHSDDWVYIRYTLARHDGQRVAPIAIQVPHGPRARGYAVFKWLEERGPTADGEVTALTLGNETISFPLRELDLSQPPVAYAYTSEKVFYLRSNLVENFPPSAYQLVHSKFENCPDIDADYLAQHRGQVEGIVDELLSCPDGRIRDYFVRIPRPLLVNMVARMYSFDNARAMLDIEKVVGQERAFTNPLEPLALSSVYLLKRNPSDPVVLRSLSLEDFATTLMIGETPTGSREIAYNAYRAVNDEEETTFVAALEQELKAQPGRTLYDVYRQHPSPPPTLYEEFELFRIMHQATTCYELNTILRQAPGVADTRQAVAQTMELLAKTIALNPQGLVLTMDNYGRYLEGDLPAGVSFEAGPGRGGNHG